MRVTIKHDFWYSPDGKSLMFYVGGKSYDVSKTTGNDLIARGKADV